MHATADTLAVKFFQRCGAARDARRYASTYGERNASTDSETD
jgi:hypothetical protein